MRTIVLATVLLMASTAEAQNIALIGQVGAMESTLVRAGGFDAYVSPRVSVRPSALLNQTESLRRAVLLWDVFYNWDYGRLRPFIGAGAGIHMLQERSGGQVVGEHDHLNFGANIGGGLEIFVTKSQALTVEVSYFSVERGRLSEAPSATALRIGFKQYFWKRVP